MIFASEWSFVYATFITEWEGGVLETLCLMYGPNYTPQLLDALEDGKPPPYSPGVFDPFYANRMVELAEYYGFDGWFINIESNLQLPEHGVAMIQFIEYLTLKCVKGFIAYDSRYDSITRDGKLSWQDRLTDLNVPFFEKSDGIFVNYTWREGYPAQSAERAGKRRADVYTGIDAWGRNTFGGGGFNVHKALRVIAKANTSAAIFAPGWTHEYFDKSQFYGVDLRFWRGVPRLLNPVYPTSLDIKPSTVKESEDDLGSVADFVIARPAGTSKGFYTDFDQGYGTSGYFIDGKQVHPSPWFNLSRQSTHPTSPFIHTDNLTCLDASSLSQCQTLNPTLTELPRPPQLTVDAKPFVRITSTTAYSGGSALVINLILGSELWQIPISKLAVSMNTDMEVSCRIQTTFPDAHGFVFGVYTNVRLQSGDVVVAMSVMVDWEDVRDWRLRIVKLLFDERYENAVVTEVGVLVSYGGTHSDPRLIVGSIGVRPVQPHVKTKSLTAVDFTFHHFECHGESWEGQVSWEWTDIDPFVDRWEVYIDGVWTGTAYVECFWVILEKALNNFDILCDGYGGDGEKVVSLQGNVDMSGYMKP
ncbi:glycosyl hydrolase family 85-domain-containing protein [Chytridium lagenaria]|nr:glycosyl hydrolase family 85-domain-containing protein [Chytridium lagenaria]